MSSYDKLVKSACKPKPAPPKAKYLDPIVAATWSTDGAVHDVCKALSPRFREPNAIVVFKALIVLHYMIRNGSTDNVLSYLSTSDVLRLRNVSDGNWEGYNTPQNLQNYASYLNTRIRAYRDLKHDAIRVQSESNRDLRNQNSIEEDTARGRRKGRGGGEATTSGHTRSKTMMGRKLRVMTVEKGLLRETKIVQQMIAALLECRFYLGDLEDELTIAALRMLTMDLLILFQAGNEGVINVLEHYFEMSHVDAVDALKIYRQFCLQAEGVVEFLGVAKKLQNLLNVPIPNLKHAPVSLAGALEEYLNDPNFEQNRIDYRASKENPLKSSSLPSPQSPTAPSQEKSKSVTTPSVSTTPASAAASTSKPPAAVDLLTAIEEEQPMVFNQQTNGAPSNAFQQSPGPNPFVQLGLAAGQPFAASPTQIQMQPTGFLMPQQTAFPLPLQSNPFGPALQVPSAGMLQPYAPNGGLPQLSPTGGDFLRPQVTAANPFRQSMLVPQTTGAALFTPQGIPTLFQPGLAQPYPSSGGPTLTTPSSLFSPRSVSSSATSSAFSDSTLASPLSQPPLSAPAFSPPARPASTPLTSFKPSSQQLSPMSPPIAQPVKTHQTGSRNPFGPSISERTELPPVPKQPTLMELAMGIGTATATDNPPPQPLTGLNGTAGTFRGNVSAPVEGSSMASVASTFSFAKRGGESNSITAGLPVTGALNAQNTSTTVTGSAFSDSLASYQISQSTGITAFSGSSAAPSVTLSPSLKPQTTGFTALKPFKPTSSFGAALLESLPPIPTSPTSPSISPTTAATGSMTLSSGFGASNISGARPSGFTGSTLGVGLRPQMTGSGAANPFRASMMTPSTGSAPSFSPSTTKPFMGSASPSTSAFGANIGSSISPTTGPSFGAGLFLPGSGGTPFGSNFGSVASQQQQQQQGGMSLI